MRRERNVFVVTALVLPVGLFLLFMVSPYVQAVGYSFTNWQGFSPDRQFVGLDNYARLFRDGMFWRAVLNNGFLAVLTPLFAVGLAMFFASMFNFGLSTRRIGAIQGVPGTSLLRVIYFFPQVLSIAITSVLWQQVFNPRNGILNSALSVVGIDGPVWLADSRTALWTVLIVMVWSSVGFYVVILTAAMAGVPRELYEAATIDGASVVRQFFSVTVPMIRDTLWVSVIFSVITALDGFALVQIMTIGPGGPDGATTVIGFYMYDQAFTYSQYGYASAMGVVLCLFVVGFALTVRIVSRERNA